MLRALPAAWYSSAFRLVQADGREVGLLKSALWGERATFTVKDVTFELYRERLLGDFVVTFEGVVLARAQKPSAFDRRFTLSFEEQSYTLEAASAFKRAFVLRDADGVEGGGIRPLNAFTRRAEIDVPEALPLPVQAFCFWLVLVLWNRSAAAS